MKIGQKIQIIRTSLGLTQQQFGERINKTGGFISNVEKGKSNLSEKTVDDICAVFRVNRDYLTGYSDEMFSEEIVVADDRVNARVKQIRKEKGLTQNEFAELLGCSVDQVKSIESNRRNPSVSWLKNAAEKLNVSLDWLQTGRGPVRSIEQDIEKIVAYLKVNDEARARILKEIDESGHICR